MMSYIKRNCDNCGKEYMADTRNLKRGWGLCCSKRCAALKRERNKPGYNPSRVAANNVRREEWNNNYEDLDYDDPGDSEYWDNSDNYSH